MRPSLPLILWAALPLVASPAFSTTTLVDSQGFEGPLNNLGPLAGQVASTQDGSGTAVWQESGGGQAVIQDAVVAPGGGDQAARIDRLAGTDGYWGVFEPVTSGSAVVFVEWDMRVEAATGPAGSFGPLFGVSIFNQEESLSLLGSLTVDSTTLEVLSQATGTGFLTPTGLTVAPGAWNHFRIEVDLGTDQYRLFVNDAPTGPAIGFVDGPAAGFTDASLTAAAGAGDPASLALTGTAYFDNFQIMVVPEPTSPALMIFGGLLASGRRSRKDGPAGPPRD